MNHPLPTRRSIAVATAAASALLAAPALATEGPAAPPPAAPLPSGVTPITFAPVTPAGAPAARRARVIRRAQLVPRRVRAGRRALLRVWLVAPSRLRIVIARPGGRRVRVVNVPARGRRVALRLPARAHGRLLRAGSYRVSVVAVDGQGGRSQPVGLTLAVRRPAR